MKTLMIKSLTLMGVIAVLFGTAAATPALADGGYRGKPTIHHRHRHHRHWHRHAGRRS